MKNVISVNFSDSVFDAFCKMEKRRDNQTKLHPQKEVKKFVEELKDVLRTDDDKFIVSVGDDRTFVEIRKGEIGALVEFRSNMAIRAELLPSNRVVENYENKRDAIDGIASHFSGKA